MPNAGVGIRVRRDAYSAGVQMDLRYGSEWAAFTGPAMICRRLTEDTERRMGKTSRAWVHVPEKTKTPSGWQKKRLLQSRLGTSGY
jgi:hypothetical protein